VQHFYSYVTLLAAVMIRPVKTPWKRFGFYSIAIVCGWYATVSTANTLAAALWLTSTAELECVSLGRLDAC